MHSILTNMRHEELCEDGLAFQHICTRHPPPFFLEMPHIATLPANSARRSARNACLRIEK